MLKLTFALLLIATVLHSATAAPPYSRETPVEIRSEADRLLAAEWKRNRLEVPAGASDSVRSCTSDNLCTARYRQLSGISEEDSCSPSGHRIITIATEN